MLSFTLPLQVPHLCVCVPVRPEGWGSIVGGIGFPLAFSQLGSALWWWFEIQFGGVNFLAPLLSLSLSFF